MMNFKNLKTIDPVEAEKFDRLADLWWNPKGKMWPLHRLNKLRAPFVIQEIERYFGKEGLEGLNILDIGCGAGLLSEQLAKQGASVTGIDAAGKNIEIAQQHALGQDLTINYLHGAVEDLESDQTFDVVLNMEVVEHVADVPGFLQACASLFRSDDSSMVVATLNRTVKAYLLAIVGAEYVLGWLPKGTHDWNRFIRPSEFRRYLAAVNLEIKDLSGISYEPVSRGWRLSSNLAVNYMGFVIKP